MEKYDVVLLPTFTQVEDWRKRQVDECGQGLVSVTITTFNAWIADLWELHGDGRAIVDSLQRQTVMQAACADDELLAGLPGAPRLAAKCVRAASGVPQFEGAVLCAENAAPLQSLSPNERSFLAAIARYKRLLESIGFIEVGDAAAYLSARAATVFPCGLRVLVEGSAPPDWRMRHFFDSCPQLCVDVRGSSEPTAIGRVPQGTRVRFAFPSGKYAQPALVCDFVREALRESGADAGASASESAFEPVSGSAPGLASAPDPVPAPAPASAGPLAVIASPDPLALFKQVERPLAAESVHVCVQAQLPFQQTDFGRAFLAMCHVVHDERWSPAQLTDVLLSPFSGFSRSRAYEIDAIVRADRTSTKEGCLMWLCAESDTFSQFEELASSPDADILAGVFEEIALSSHWRSEVWRSEQLSAIAALRSVTKAARMIGIGMRQCRPVLEHTVVTVSYESVGRQEPPSAARVVVTTQDVAAQMGEGSCSLLVATDLTHLDYSIAESDDAASTLFGKLGLEPTDSSLARARRTFKALMALPRGELVCVRPLNDYDGNPTYPCAVVQELVDAYRDDPASDDGLDAEFGLPDCLMEGTLQRGEEVVYANARAQAPDVAQACAARIDEPRIGAVSASKRDVVLLPHRLGADDEPDRFLLTASQIERYLECPYKWFVSNRVKVTRLDESFGALERGTFAHAVLERFYRRFMEAGFGKVTASTLPEARRLMREVADELEREQCSLEPGSGRLVAIDQLEERDLDALKNQLVSYLEYEAELLPAFEPAHLEFKIELEDRIEYAGGILVGKIDRIDVDGRGNAVVIDYKGSAGPDYEIAGKGAGQPGKVQTRIYAQAVRRALGLNVVGAFYVSYGKKHALAGAYDPRVLDAAHLPAMRVDRCRCAPVAAAGPERPLAFSDLTFTEALDLTEELAAEAVAAMRAGMVEPDPVSPGACEYCPVLSCPKRGA